MKTVLLLLAALLVGTPASASDTPSSAVQTMAGVLADFNHFPSDADKAALQEVIDDPDTTEHERTVAQAIANVEHQPTAADKMALAKVANDDAAPEGVRTLARIVVDLAHTPSPADKEALAGLADQ